MKLWQVVAYGDEGGLYWQASATRGDGAKFWVSVRLTVDDLSPTRERRYLATVVWYDEFGIRHSCRPPTIERLTLHHVVPCGSFQKRPWKRDAESDAREALKYVSKTVPLRDGDRDTSYAKATFNFKPKLDPREVHDHDREIRDLLDETLTHY